MNQTQTTAGPQAPEPRWTIAELQARAEQALAVDYDGVASGRVRSIPNERALRYYTTIGLLDRPAEMRGRTAYYGWRHLLQVVAVKRLQAAGLNLVDIQQRLTGRPLAALAAMAQLPANPSQADLEWSPTEESEAEPQEENAAAVGVGRRRQPFWRVTDASAPNEPKPLPAATGLQSLRLNDDAVLLWTGNNVEDRDLAALRRAAQPLITELARRGLLYDPRESGDEQ